MRHSSHESISAAQEAYVRAHPLDISACWRAASLRGSEGLPMTMRRALSLNAVLEKCALPIFPGSLLAGVGAVGRFAPKGARTAAQLQEARGCVAAVGERTFASQADHHAPDYATLLRRGFGGLRAQALGVRQGLAGEDPRGVAFLDSVIVALEGATAYMRRWSGALAAAAAGPAAAASGRCSATPVAIHAEGAGAFTAGVAQVTTDASRIAAATAVDLEEATASSPYAELLRHQSRMFQHLATAPPSGFHQALQLVYCYHGMMQLDGRGAMAFGRLDQFLYPLYRRDLDSGRETKASIQALLDHFFARITIDADVQNITLGGTRADGSEGTSELSCQILEACRRVARPGGNCTARIHARTPQVFLEKCVEVIRTGIGYPALVNEEITIRGLLAYGYPEEDARDYCCVGCIETQIPGRQVPWTDRRINPLKALHLALFRGRDLLTGERVGPDTGEPSTFEDFYAAFQQQFAHMFQQQAEATNALLQSFAARAGEFTSPLLSALVADCISRARDVNDGGARYEGNVGYGAMGIASVADSLAAVKHFVYATGRFDLGALRNMLAADFVGYEMERQLLLRGAPKFGNDDDTVDELAVRAMEDFLSVFQTQRTPRGGFHWMLMASNVQNITAGREVGATPDGRRSGEPTSDACSPTFGRDTAGPTATIRSIAKLPYRLAPGGNVVNMKLDPVALRGPAGVAALVGLIRSCFALGGSELQFNTTDTRTLRAAMETPESYEDLVVRVSGFSATYVRLERAVQEDILARTEHVLNT